MEMGIASEYDCFYAAAVWPILNWIVVTGCLGQDPNFSTLYDLRGRIPPPPIASSLRTS
jgi:hypothetical protein